MSKPDLFDYGVLRRVLVALGLLLHAAAAPAGPADSAQRWVGTWTAAPQLTEPHNLPPEPGFADTTVRQVIRLTIGGPRLRVKFSNAYGNADLRLISAHIARAGEAEAILPESDTALTFNGQPGIVVPRGALIVSDPFDFDVPAHARLAITIHLQGAPSDVTGHPGSRTTSYFVPGNRVAAERLGSAVRVDHWYFLSGVDVWSSKEVAAVVVLGDSLTDGRGSTTNGNDRWTDQLSDRLRANPATAHVAVLNQGLGGNRMLRDGLGPNVLARLDRDVIAQPGVCWLIVFIGINDLGTANGARARGEPAATARDMIGAFEQIVVRAHAHGIRVYGGTITPCGGSFYDSPELEADRQAINHWMRTSGVLDAVIDFDAAIRDPENPARLVAAADTGDHLHLNPEGYRMMAAAVDPGLFGGQSQANGK